MTPHRTAPRAAKEAPDTREQILDLAETLIQTRSYGGFSYQDISDALGIRKASIHYHFPSKTDLGVAVIDRYAERFEQALTGLANDAKRSSLEVLEFYFQPYLEFAGTTDRVCLCGSLAGEMLTLPDEMRARVDRFFRSHQAWLQAVLKRGEASGEFKLAAPATKTARMILGALQGGLLVKRTTGDAAQLKDVVSVLRAQLTA
jgi:TetR/AcrR family transcriptional regulator, transcriptional repressor for nem operon